MNKLATALKAQAKNTKSPLIDLVEKLFQSRDMMHLAHLKSNSYAQHVSF